MLVHYWGEGGSGGCELFGGVCVRFVTCGGVVGGLLCGGRRDRQCSCADVIVVRGSSKNIKGG